MLELQAHCPFCLTEASLDVEDLLLLSPASEALMSRAVFHCVACTRRVSVEIEDQVAALLELRGARRVRGHPSMSGPVHHRPAGPAFTPDDLLDFHELLEEPGWFDRLLDVSRH